MSEKQVVADELLNRCAKWFICGFLLSALLPVLMVVLTSSCLIGLDVFSRCAELAPSITNTVPTNQADRDAYARNHYVPPDPRQPIKPSQLPTAAELRDRRAVIIQELEF